MNSLMWIVFTLPNYTQHLQLATTQPQLPLIPITTFTTTILSPRQPHNIITTKSSLPRTNHQQHKNNNHHYYYIHKHTHLTKLAS